MAKVRTDEVLGKALASDPSVIPRFTIKKPDGTIVAENATIELTNPVVTAGMAVDKQAMDECLAASGTTGGSSTAYTLTQTGFALFDGALVRIKLHKDTGNTPTLNINGTGAKKLMQDKYTPLRSGIAAGTWLTFVYSTTFGTFVQQGSSAQGSGQVSTALDDIEICIGHVTQTGWTTVKFDPGFSGAPLVLAVGDAGLADVANVNGLTAQIYGPAKYIAVYDGGVL